MSDEKDPISADIPKAGTPSKEPVYVLTDDAPGIREIYSANARGRRNGGRLLAAGIAIGGAGIIGTAAALTHDMQANTNMREVDPATGKVKDEPIHPVKDVALPVAIGGGAVLTSIGAGIRQHVNSIDRALQRRRDLLNTPKDSEPPSR